MTQEILASQALQNLNQALVNAFVQREDGQAKVDEANLMIKAIRNQLGGIQTGQKLQQQIDAEVAAEAAAAAKAKQEADMQAQAAKDRDVMQAMPMPLHEAVVHELHPGPTKMPDLGHV